MPYNSAINLDVTKNDSSFHLSGASSKLLVSGEAILANDGSGILNGQLLIGNSGDSSFNQGNLYGAGNITILSGAGTLGVSGDTSSLYPRTNPSGYVGASSITGRQTIWIPAGAMSASTVSGAAAGQVALGTNMPDVISYDFDASNIENTLFNIAMPKSWDIGPVYGQFVWSHLTGATGTVVWQLQGFAVSDGESLASGFAGGVTVSDASTTGNFQRITAETSALLISGTPARDDVLYFRASRLPADAADTLGIDARLMGLKLIYGVTGGNDN